MLTPHQIIFQTRPSLAAPVASVIPECLLRIDGLSVSLMGHPALSDICLEIHAGEFVLMSGPSGSGKSTLARAVAGLLNTQPDVHIEGTVAIGTLDVLNTPAAGVAEQVGIVFQNPRAQLFNLTAAEELACGPRNLSLEPEAIESRVAWVVESLNLGHLLHRRLDTLSGGEMQRIAIGAVLAMGPRILILDEPTSSLDIHGTQQVIGALERLNREHGTTIILIEHRLDEVTHLATRAVLLEDGHIVADRPTHEVFGNHALLRRLGMRHPEAATAAIDWAHLIQPDHRPAMGNGVGDSCLLRLENVEARYGKKTVLSDINLTLHAGEFAALVGENGAGKSTLAMVAAGLIRPHRGKVVFCGRRRARLGLDVGLLFQNPLDQLFCDTVDEEVAFGPRNYDCYTPDAHVRTLVKCDLHTLRTRSVYALSAGQQQRTALAAVVSLRPTLLILDEPTLGQSWGHLEQLMNYLRRLNEHGMTILIVTHDYRLVRRYAHRVILLHAGAMVADGQPGSMNENI